MELASPRRGNGYDTFTLRCLFKPFDYRQSVSIAHSVDHENRQGCSRELFTGLIDRDHGFLGGFRESTMLTMEVGR